MTTQVVVVIEGGLVQAVYVNNKEISKVAIVDFDNENFYENELKTNQYGCVFYSRYESTIQDEDYTNEIFEQLENYSV